MVFRKHKHFNRKMSEETNNGCHELRNTNGLYT